MAFLDLRLRNSLSTTYLILLVILIHHFANIGPIKCMVISDALYPASLYHHRGQKWSRRFQIFWIQEENVFIEEIWTPEL